METKQKIDEQKAKEIAIMLYSVNRKERRKRMKKLGLTKKEILPMTKAQSEAISAEIFSTQFDSRMYWALMALKKRNKYFFENADTKRRELKAKEVTA
jgi:hypothetical protein